MREDDADYLSSRWLAQDCAEDGKLPNLEEYLAYQIAELEIRKKEEERKPPHISKGDPLTFY